MNTDTKKTKPSRVSQRLGIAVLALIVIWIIQTMLQSPLLEVGTEAPLWSIELADGSGAQVKLQDLKGNVVVLSFWSTTCPPCMRELKNLDSLWPDYRKKGVKFIGIAAGGEDNERVRAFNKKKRLGFPLGADDGTIAPKYQVNTLPALYVIDQYGKVAAALNGYKSKEILAREISIALVNPS